jgi:hypothetical protein
MGLAEQATSDTSRPFYLGKHLSCQGIARLEDAGENSLNSVLRRGSKSGSGGGGGGRGGGASSEDMTLACY